LKNCADVREMDHQRDHDHDRDSDHDRDHDSDRDRHPDPDHDRASDPPIVLKSNRITATTLSPLH